MAVRKSKRRVDGKLKLSRTVNRSSASLRSAVELMERRILMSVTLDSGVPTSIVPSSVGVTPLAPGINLSTVPTSTTQYMVTQSLIRFSVDNAVAGQPTVISTTPASGNADLTDAGIALFDKDGNRIAFVDGDTGTQISIENMSAILQSNQPYELGIYVEKYSAPGSAVDTINVSINEGAQLTAATVSTSATSGVGSVLATGATGFNSSTSTDYYPITFTDGGPNGSVAITAGGPDTNVAADLYVQAASGGAYTLAASGTGTPTLNVTAPTGADLVDENYVLAVSPAGFTAAPEAFTISASSTTTVEPASISSMTTTYTLAPAIQSPGTISFSTAGIYTASVGSVSLVTAPVSGPVTLTYVAGGLLPPALAVYGPGGSTLIGVATSQVGGSVVTYTFNASAGTTYEILAAADATQSNTGFYTLNYQQSYVPTPLTATTTVATQAKLNVSPASGAQIFRITPPAGATFLALQLLPDSGSSLTGQVTVVSGSGAATTYDASAAGGAVNVPVNLSVYSGVVDVEVTSTAGTGTASFSYAGVAVTPTIAIDQYPTSQLNVSTGSLTSTSLNLSTFGASAGIQYYAFKSANPTTPTYTAQTTAGSSLLLAHYSQIGGVLQLQDVTAANSSGTSTSSPTITGGELQALVAVSLNPTGGQTATVSVSNATPIPVQVGMVPNALPGSTQTSNFASDLKISGAIFASSEQSDYYQTLLPANISTTTGTLTFTPGNIGGTLAATFAVYNASGGQLAKGTSTAGSFLTISVPNLTAQGTLTLSVSPVAGSAVGTGVYSIDLNVATTDPRPYLVTESTFYPYSSAHPNTVGYLPSNLTIQTLTLNGSVAGSFTSSQYYYQGGNSGSIAVYALTVPATPFSIYTTDDSANVPVNTDIAVYQPNYTGSSITSFSVVPGSSPDFDYYPANRTTVDAEINFNNLTEISTTTIYVVVKNEQGTLGSYHIHAAALSPTTLGPGTNDLSSFGQTQGIFNLNASAASVTGVVVPYDLYALNTPFNLVNSIYPRNFYPTITVNFGTSYNGQLVTLLLYTGINGTPSSYLTSISGGNATFSQPLNPTSVYYFKIVATGSSAFNTTISYFTVSSGSVPASTDSLLPATGIGQGDYGTPTEPYTHADPSPAGTYSSTMGTFGSKTGTLIKDVFWNPSPGPVMINVSLPTSGTNLTVGLYQVVYNYESGFGEKADGNLIGYSNSPGADGNYDFNAFLSPGAYYIKATGTVSGTFNFATITGQTPAFVAQKITVNPTSGSDAQPVQDTIDSGPALSTAFQTVFYEADVPANVGAGHTAFNVSGGYGYTSFANVTAWAVSGPPITSVQSTGDTFGNVGVSKAALNNPSPFTSTGGVTTSDMPVAGGQYFFGLDRSGLSTDVTLSVSFPVYQSGTPDLVVNPLVLTGQDGETHVTVTVTNKGYAQAGSSNGLFTFSNYANTSSVTIPTIGALGSWTYTAYWIPVNPANTVSFVADSKNQLAELSKSNNLQSVALSTVDPSLPTETIALSDPLMTSEGSAAAGVGGGTWGRYVSGVIGQTVNVLVAATAGAPINSVSLRTSGYSSNISGATSLTLTEPVDFGTFSPTSASSPNQFSFDTIDIFGLTTGPHYQMVDVAPKSKFLTTETFSVATHQFTLGWVDNIINQSETLDQLLNTSLPIVGDDNNQFLINLSASGTATLNPATAISLPLTGHILIEALNSSLYDKTFNGSDQPTKNLSIHTTLAISGKTLTPTAAVVSLQLTNLNLLNYTSPKITLFSYGIADIASLDADFYYGISANLNAGVKVGINPSFITDPLNAPFDLGLMSPTYIQPSVTATAYIDGQVSVFGIDLADLTGSLGLTLTLTLGLDNNYLSTLVPLSQVPGDLTYAVNATLNLGLSAHVAFFGQIWSYSYPINLGNIIDTTKQGIITSDPADGGSLVTVSGLTGAIPGAIAKGLASPAGVSAGTVNTASGSTLVGTVPVDPRPQIVINDAGAAPGTSPYAIAAQVVNAGTASAPVGNIEVSTRTNGTWSGQTVLVEANDVGTPSLALTHDAAGPVPAVLTYVADNVAGAPAGQTINQRADASDIRYRYFNGSVWSAEQSVTSDNLYDSDPTVFFNTNGSGVLAYIHNTDPAPLATSGFDAAADDIAACVWNATTHTWSAPVAITGGDGFDDTKPATFVDSTGKQYIVWIRNGSNGDETNQLMYSVYGGSGWSTAAVLPITGLTPGGSFGDVTVGSDASGRIDVVFSYRTLNADNSENSVLYNRPTTTAAFTSAATLVEISQDQNYSYLQTTTSPTGSLVVSWEQSDGVDNQVFATDVTNSGGTDSAFTTPTQLTDNPDVTVAPSVAVDASGKMQILYDHDLEPGQTTAGTAIDPTVGVGLATGVSSSSLQMLPQFSFQNGLYFNAGSAVPTGSQATGTAVIVNRGLVSAPVTISAYLGQPGTGTLVGSSNITLGPGSTYNVSQLFTAAAGTNTYSIQLTTVGSQEVDTAENLSTATLTGQADLAMISVTPSVTNPVPGQSFSLVADIRNLSTTTIGTFTVSLTAGDPRFSQVTPVLLSSQNVSSVGGGQDVYVTFPVTPPNAGGNYVYTIRADSNNVIAESNKANNDGQYAIEFSGDPAITAVVPTLLNYTGIYNVSVAVTVVNNGQFPLTNLPIDLVPVVQNDQYNRSLGNASTTIASLGPGASTVVTFNSNGLAGTNYYQALIDPSAEGFDSNLSDNSFTATLSIQALPTLNVNNVYSSVASPHQNDPVQISASVVNSGIAHAENVLVQLQATPTGGGATLVLGSTIIADVPALEGSSVTFNVSTGSLLGSYTFTVVADPNQQVLQTTTAGDSASISLTFTGPLAQLNLSGSNFYLRLDPDGTHLDVYTNNTGTGSPTQYLESNLGAININGAAGNDAVTIDLTNGNPVPLDQLNYTGGSSAGGLGNVLNVIDHGSSDNMSVLPGQIIETSFVGSVSTDFINETNVQYVRLTPGTRAGISVYAGASAHIAPVNTGSPALRDFSSLYLGAGASLSAEPAANTASRSLFQVEQLHMDPTAKFDLSNNDLDVQAGATVSQIQAVLTSGYNLSGGANWTGPGVVSSAATHTTTLGYLLNNSASGSPYYGTGTALGLFDGYSPNPSDVLVKYTYYGDANLSGKVDGSDYSLIDGGYKLGTAWVAGDFNYDGIVDGSDYALIDNTFNNQAAGLGSVAVEVAAESAIVSSGIAPTTIGPRNAQAVARALPAATFSTTPVAAFRAPGFDDSSLFVVATPKAELKKQVFFVAPLEATSTNSRPATTRHRTVKSSSPVNGPFADSAAAITDLDDNAQSGTGTI